MYDEKVLREALAIKMREIAEGMEDLRKFVVEAASGEDYHEMLMDFLGIMVGVHRATEENIEFLQILDCQHHEEVEISEHAGGGIAALVEMLQKQGR